MAEMNRRGMNRAIKAFFDERASTWHEEVASPYERRLAQIIEDLGIARNSAVLDVGAGTGILAGQLAGHVGPEGTVVSVDLSLAMVREGKALYADGPMAWVQADILDAPFRRAVFDWVICYSVFPHFLDQQHAVKEFASLLKPGGKLAVLHSQSREAINAHHEKIGDVVGGHKLPDDAGMTGLIENAGLALLRLENSDDSFIALARK
jgi:demethylmenaquinone methyltransferase/2-methoxy-6-polyprenyl-1,4-benzoquinol methylase